MRSGGRIRRPAPKEASIPMWPACAASSNLTGHYAERVRLGELRSTAAEERADVLLALGRHEEVVPDLTAMVADHPLRERMRGLLMIALYRGGGEAGGRRGGAEGRGG